VLSLRDALADISQQHLASPWRALNPSFSTRGVGGPGNRSRTTSWSKGLHYKSYARLFSSNFPAHPVCMALKMADEVTTNDCSHKSRAGKRLGLHYRHFGAPVPLFKRLGGRLMPKNSAFLRRVEKVGLATFTAVQNSRKLDRIDRTDQPLAPLSTDKRALSATEGPRD
jgi:hypothetical protein